MLNALRNWLPWPRRPLPERWADGWQASLPSGALADVDVRGFAALQRGVEILIGQLVSTPILQYRGTSEIDGPALARIVATPPQDFELAISDMLWTGNGWLAILPDRLEAIQAARISAMLDTQGKPHYYLDGNIELDMARTVHLMARNGHSPFLGDDLLASYSASASMLSCTISIYRQIQSNAGFADMFLSTDAILTASQMGELRTKYDEQVSALQGKAGGTLIMAAGMKPYVARRLPTALEADLLKSLEFSVAEASRITGVPLAMLSQPSAHAYNSAIEASRSFYRATIRPLMYRVERELSRKLGADLRYDTAEIVLGYGIERAEVLNKLTYAGIISSNEARATLAYGAVSGGDVAGLPSNTLPRPAWLAQTGSGAPARAGEGPP